MKKILLIIILLFSLLSFNTVFGLNLNGLEMPTTKLPVDMGFLIMKVGEDYYFVSHKNYGVDQFTIAEDENGFYLNTLLPYNIRVYKIDFENNQYILADTLYFDSSSKLASSIIMSTSDISARIPGVFKNIDYPLTLFTNNDKIQVINKSNTIMKEDFNFKVNKETKGNVLITDASGKFIEQIDFDIVNGTNFSIKVPSDNEPYNIYFMTHIGYHDTVFSFDNLTQTHFSVKKFAPKYDVVGQLIYQINTIDAKNEFPYIMPTMTDTLILYKEKQVNGTYKTVPITIEKGQKHIFNSYETDDEIVFQFQHPAGSSIQVESNFTIRTSNHEISPLPKEVIDALLEEVYGGGIGDIPSNEDTRLIATPNQSVKINTLGLSEKLISEMVDAYIETTIGTTGKIEWFGQDINWKPQGDEPIRKKMQRNVTDTMNNKQKRISIGQYEYVIFTADTGSINIRIPSKFILNKDYNIEILKNYVVPPELEDEFVLNNPIIPDFGDTNDVYSKDINDNMYDWITGQSGIGSDINIPTISNVGEQITSFTDMFLGPVKTLFTGIPELYSLIIFGFGLAIVMFVLGR